MIIYLIWIIYFYQITPLNSIIILYAIWVNSLEQTLTRMLWRILILYCLGKCRSILKTHPSHRIRRQSFGGYESSSITWTSASRTLPAHSPRHSLEWFTLKQSV